VTGTAPTEPSEPTDPIDPSDRVLAAARRLGVPFEVLPCDPALADTEAFCAAYGFRGDESANTIVVVAKTDPPRYVACVVLATTRLDVNNAVRKRLGVKKASFADAETVRALTGMEIGGVTPFDLGEMEIWVDARVASCERIVLGGGSRSCKVIGPPTLLTAQATATVIEGLAIERPTTETT
jgi:prolyl-tRNA editing enzyme YbaK/EbsC (Cys-tRNA(Pro) deacylase)